MFSQRTFNYLLFLFVKGFLTTTIVLGVLLGYQKKTVGFSVMVVGFCLMGQSTQKIIQKNAKHQSDFVPLPVRMGLTKAQRR